MISWDKIQDRDVRGTSPLGPVWIRLDKKGKVTGMYTIFDTNTEKYILDEEWKGDLGAAKLVLEDKYKEAESVVT